MAERTIQVDETPDNQGALKKIPIWKRPPNIDMLDLQNYMLEQKIIDAPLTFSQMQNIRNNPFLRFAPLFGKIKYTQDEHEEFKKSFGS